MSSAISNLFILDEDGKTPVGIGDDNVHEWGLWFEEATRTGKRFVGKDTVGVFRVSTVFLGLDYAFGDGTPLLFETMIFGGSTGHEYGSTTRYPTWNDAKIGHSEAILQADSLWAEMHLAYSTGLLIRHRHIKQLHRDMKLSFRELRGLFRLQHKPVPSSHVYESAFA